LRRWLGNEPTRARPAWPLRKMWLWSKRNKGWAAAIAVGVLAFLAPFLTLSAVWIQQANARAETAQRDLQLQRLQAEAAKRELQLQRLQQVRLTPHRNGWSDDVWELVRSLGKVRYDLDLRNQAAATLIGLDATVAKRYNDLGASSVAFDATGKRLL